MAIRYDDKLKKEIYRVAGNVNRKLKYNKFKTRGKGILPEHLSASKFMAKYSDKSRKELQKQLQLYKDFGKRDALNLISDNSRISKWEYNYFKANMDKTKQFYDDEINDFIRITGYEGKQYRFHERILNLQAKREFLNKDITELTDDEIKTMRRIFSYAERSEIVKQQGFRLYLSQLERTMDNLGYTKAEIDELLNKFNVLTENEFTEMVRNEDIIDAVYDIVDSPKGRGKYQLMTDEKRARKIVKEIEGRADELIAKYKKHD